MSALSYLGYFQARRTFKLPREELERLQMRKLKALLRYARDNDTFWNETFKRIGFNPEDVSSPADLGRLPTLTKSDTLKAQEAAKAAGKLEGIRVVMSSGTTGTPSGFARGPGRSFNKALSIRQQLLYGLRPWTRVATLWAPQRYWKTEVDGDGTSKPYTGIYENPAWQFRSVLNNIMTLWVNPSDPAGDAKALRAFNPEVIYSRPSHLRRIARYCGSDLGIRPRLIAAGGETITKTGFKELRGAYGAKVVRAYGSSDVGKLASDCLYERGLHMWEDYRIYEVLKDGEPVSPGEVGELVVTNLPADVVPIIRFRTGDFVRLADDGKCECGSSLRRLSSIEGRANDWVIGKDGEKFLALDVADHLESDFGLRDFQLVQNGLSTFSLLLRPDDLDRLADITGVRGYIEGMVGSAVTLDVRPRSDDDFWIKTRPVVCKCA